MTSSPKTPARPVPNGSAPYPFRVLWAGLLLGINFLVAAIYFKILNI